MRPSVDKTCLAHETTRHRDFAMRLLEPKKPHPEMKERLRREKTLHLVDKKRRLVLAMRLLVFEMRRLEDKPTHLENEKAHRLLRQRHS
ncbi:MAG TPA: hypothetical protein VGL81_25330 [Polyangiaceae bacterium]